MCLKSLQRLKLNIIKVNTRLQSKPVLETFCGLVSADFDIDEIKFLAYCVGKGRGLCERATLNRHRQLSNKTVAPELLESWWVSVSTPLILATASPSRPVLAGLAAGRCWAETFS